MSSLSKFIYTTSSHIKANYLFVSTTILAVEIILVITYNVIKAKIRKMRNTRVKKLHFIKFPVVVQKRIFNFMNTRDVFVLSLCSKKLAISVQNCKSAQQYMTQMCYKTFVRHQHQFVIENEYVLLLVPDLILKAGLWFWCKDFELEGVRFRVENGPDGSLILWSINSSFKTSHLAIDKRLRSIHRPTSEIHLNINSKDFTTCLPHIENINYAFLKNTSGINRRFKSADIEQLNMKNLVICNPIDGRFENDSGILNLNHLYLTNAGSTIDLPTWQFNGRHLWLSGANISNEDVIHCLELWQSGAAFQNLESLLIRTEKGYPLEPAMIYNQLDANPWDSDRRPQYYVFDENVRYFNFSNNCSKMDFARYLDIEGIEKMASIYIMPHCLELYVWKL
ncbi:F-box domain-containing protein [Caenorhabditis elegans]|uniref:F-box domain-containing protein n=1 Tax=Caenorhabditis elegans TaxID=6239 RepID=C3JXE4_CAEEL|nr:F-box domain-containing protein [Caenorhabditis elegans]CCD70942.1 F-box domain-containing protein [Caenorhabditis elegans]|eukprot:NP_497166.3 Uncharacterized protein CELE_F40G9.9 [Caenorhabditis elegans]